MNYIEKYTKRTENMPKEEFLSFIFNEFGREAVDELFMNYEISLMEALVLKYEKDGIELPKEISECDELFEYGWSIDSPKLSKDYCLFYRN